MALIPAVVITNDWFTGLVPAYAKKSSAFGSVFSGSTFIHLIHNLGDGYEGRIYPSSYTDYMNEIHHLDNELLVDPLWSRVIINPSRCAIKSCDQWATVSKSYRDDILSTSSLGPLLRRFTMPFAVSNGIRKGARLEVLERVAPDHATAKARLQKVYFGKEDASIPVFAFVGRVTQQKGVHLIVDAVEELITKTGGRIQILVGGPASPTEQYAAYCAGRMHDLHTRFPLNFWANPSMFFTDGALVNLGADFGLMPSLFEPGGVVQHEFFVAGTPVIAFKTGGLKDSVFEYDQRTGKGNGLTFEAHNYRDYIWAVSRALELFASAEHYGRIRENAFQSVLTTSQVAWAWFRELCRLRKRLSAPHDMILNIHNDLLTQHSSSSSTMLIFPNNNNNNNDKENQNNNNNE